MNRVLELGRMFGISPVCVLAQGSGGSHMDGYRHVMSSWTGDIAMWILLIVVVGILVPFPMQNLHPKQTPDTSNDTPLEILEKRYARSEITKEEFEEMKRLL